MSNIYRKNIHQLLEDDVSGKRLGVYPFSFATYFRASNNLFIYESEYSSASQKSDAADVLDGLDLDTPVDEQYAVADYWDEGYSQ